jgi:two-component system, NtrC family, sensor kinase
MNTSPAANRRILVVDDNLDIQKDFRTILETVPQTTAAIDAEAELVFGGPAPIANSSEFEIEMALQGEEALQMVRRACEARRPYAMAFIDMRMPPGWDGLTTISRIWELDTEIQIVICTAYSDRSWEDIQTTLSQRDRWLVLKKPFDKIEVLQLAHALTDKWTLARQAGLHMESLEQMVAARTADLQKAHRVSREFLANANHELFTPMNGICGSLDIVADSNLDAEQRLFVDQARQCAADLLRLLNQILEFNRAEAGLLDQDLVEFSPLALLEEVVRAHAAAASGKGLQLRAQCAIISTRRWVGHTERIRRTLDLLADNAIKFTGTGSVTLSCQPAGDGLEFSVKDTGPGMTPQELEWIKIPFAQVDGGLSRKSSGFGLGLPLAQRLVAAMGGTLSVEAQAGRGATIVFVVNPKELISA